MDNNKKEKRPVTVFGPIIADMQNKKAKIAKKVSDLLEGKEPDDD